MSMEITRVRDALQAFEFKRLFVEELGWNRAAMRFSVTLRVRDEEDRPPTSPKARAVTLRAIAEIRGMMVFTCSPVRSGHIPKAAKRCRIQRKERSPAIIS